jgi:TRAP-type mannitol/chloroaromatic compound transport system substrate-binding protein
MPASFTALLTRSSRSQRAVLPATGADAPKASALDQRCLVWNWPPAQTGPAFSLRVGRALLDPPRRTPIIAPPQIAATAMAALDRRRQKREEMEMSRFGMGLGLAVAFAAGTAQAAEFRMLTSWDKTNPAMVLLAEGYAKAVAAASKDQIKFTLSGPETVPPFEQLQPVQSGVFHMLFTHGVYHYGTTGISVALDSLRGTIDERRASGIAEMVDKHYQKLGVKLVALPISHTAGYHIVLRAPVSANGDLAGRKIRGTPSYHPLLAMLGASAVVLPGGEVYGALEKGVVDGAAWPASGVLATRWYEVAKYMLRPGFGVNHYLFLMNLAAWNKLSDAERKLLSDEGRKIEEIWYKEYDRMVAAEEKELLAKGMQITEMGPTQKAKLNQAFSVGLWSLAIKKSGKEAEDLRALAKSKGLTD